MLENHEYGSLEEDAMDQTLEAILPPANKSMWPSLLVWACVIGLFILAYRYLPNAYQ